jgi:LmbE family N-acetylglucosaminyl deacetylase
VALPQSSPWFNQCIRKELTPEERLLRKRKHRKRRIIVYGSLFTLGYALFLWIPWQLDVFPPKPTQPDPAVDPDTKRLFSPGTKVLLITAHPDDSAFYTGGFLTKLGASGADIHQLICTDGDKAYYGPFSEPESLRRKRRDEAIEELRAWQGQDVLFLGKADGRLRADDTLVRRIRKRIDELQPEYVLCFDGAYPPRLSHQDHRRSGEAAARAVVGAPSVRWLMKFSTSAPNWICDISKQWEAQKNLLQIHRSQFHGDRLQLVTNMVEEHAIADGERIEKDYGEGFRCIRLR